MATIPNLPTCPQGAATREWHLDGTPRSDDGQPTSPQAPGATGTSFQNSLWCRWWKKFINPNGFTCRLCTAQNWPAIVHWRAKVLPGIIASKGKAAAQDALVQAVAQHMLTQDEAEQLSNEFWPGE